MLQQQHNKMTAFKAVVVALIAVLAYFIIKVIWSFDLHLEYKKHHPGNCRHVKGHEFGAEDLQVTTEGLAFISSGFIYHTASEEFHTFRQEHNITGKIFLFDFNNPEAGALELKIRHSDQFDLDTFGPHGISLLEDKVKSEHILYVLNHPLASPDRVEKFRFVPDTKELIHLRYFTSNLFRQTNDVVVVEEDRFYVTNYLYFLTAALNVFENLFLPLGSIVFYNGSHFTTSVSQLMGPNGLALSKNKRHLYVNLPISREVKVYERNEDNSLVLLQTLDVGSAVDNPNISPSGRGLFIGSHPIVYKAFQHLWDPRKNAPSSVIYVPLRDDGKMADQDGIIELFYDHGDLIKGSTAAFVYNNQLLIGSIIDRLVICDLNGQILANA